LTKYERDPLEVFGRGIAAKPLSGQALKRLPEAIDLVNLVNAEPGNAGSAVALDLDNPFL
jgi:hypothetical protein